MTPLSALVIGVFVLLIGLGLLAVSHRKGVRFLIVVLIALGAMVASTGLWVWLMDLGSR